MLVAFDYVDLIGLDDPLLLLKHCMIVLSLGVLKKRHMIWF